jgi:hypothetical protein
MQVNAMIIDSYIKGGGKVAWPNKTDMTRDELINAVYRKRDQAQSESNPIRLLSVIARLETELLSAMKSREQCAPNRSTPQSQRPVAR